MSSSTRLSSFFDQASVKTLQGLVWGVVSLILFFTYLPEDGWRQATIYALLGCTFYSALIYTNILFLFPKLYSKGNRTAYILSAIALILILAFIRGLVYWYIYNTWFLMKHKMQLSSTIYSCILSNLFIYILSLVFRISLAYFGLKKQAQEISLQKSQAELNLLKSQVQPHFLFNTLNNIYYEAYRESPRTALLLERLSDIMRYFVDESPRQFVKLSTEIRFLENYMALEQIRVRHGVTIDFQKTGDPETQVPPMLLMTFVENLFKHGIDKASEGNSVSIVLHTTDNRLIFETRNRLHPITELAVKSNSFGLKNLEHRLHILYGQDFFLETREEGPFFVARLHFPINQPS